jgi:predicted nucleotidyltransferase
MRETPGTGIVAFVGGVMGGAVIEDRVVEEAADVLRRCETIAAAYLLGSAATGRLRSDSDVDIAVLPVRPGAIGTAARLALAEALARVFERPVDLGLLSTANVVYAKEAITTGRKIVDRDRATSSRFAMLGLSMYASLQEARREVLRAYAA